MNTIKNKVGVSMIKLGEKQELQIKRFKDMGAFLNTVDGNDDDILLPKSQLPSDAKVGDILEVFVYNDSKDRIIATRKEPKITLGRLAHLKAIDVTKIGVFLEWGLEKDLFLPFSETIGAVEKGKTYLVGMYLDKSDRLCATMKIRDMLETNPPFSENHITRGTIYSIHNDIGAFVAVEDRYDGLITKRELFGVYEVGDIIEVRVNKKLEDGKLDLSLRHRSYQQIDIDAQLILEELMDNDGVLYLNDKSSPEEIKEELSISKAGFKRATGKLLKEGKIEFIKGGIRLKK